MASSVPRAVDGGCRTDLEEIQDTSTASRGIWTSSASANLATMLGEGSTSQRIRNRHNHSLLACSAPLRANRMILLSINAGAGSQGLFPSALMAYSASMPMRTLLNAHIHVRQKLDSPLHQLDLSVQASKRKA